MNGILNGETQINSQTGIVTFDGDITTFSSNTNGGVKIYGHLGIIVNKNVTNNNDILSLIL